MITPEPKDTLPLRGHLRDLHAEHQRLTGTLERAAPEVSIRGTRFRLQRIELQILVLEDQLRHIEGGQDP